MSSEITLPRQQQKLFDALRGKGDVTIVVLMQSLGLGTTRGDNQRFMQQYLGPYLTKMNRRLVKHGLAVKPGDLKGTYRLCAL